MYYLKLSGLFYCEILERLQVKRLRGDTYFLSCSLFFIRIRSWSVRAIVLGPNGLRGAWMTYIRRNHTSSIQSGGAEPLNSSINNKLERNNSHQ